jgi:hypothetical protein
MPGFKIKKQEGYNLLTAEKETLEAITILGDPGADRILFWDESANTWKFLTIGSGLNITDETITASGGLINPMTKLGDMIYGGVDGAVTRLVGNTTTITKFLTQVGDGINSSAPSWGLDLSTDGTFADNSDTKIPSQKAVKTALSGKEDSLGFTPENVANKSTSVDTDKTSDTKYSSVKSIYDWATGLFQTLSNLVTAFQETPDDIHYPSEKLVKNSLDTKAPSASPTFTGTVTLPKAVNIKDTSADHEYQLGVSELAANRTVTLPLLTGNDTFMFKDFHKASSAEINTGTEDNKYVTPDGLAGSNIGTKMIQLKIIDDATALTTGDGKIIFMIPEEMNGMNLVKAHAMVSTVSSSGTPTIQIRNVTDSVDMLSTKITIDASEYTSYTAATAPVIDTSKDDVATGDRIAIDVDSAGSGAKGLTIFLAFRLP